MSGKDDPFGGRTVIIPNPGGAARRDPIEPLPPLSPAREAAIAAGRSRCVRRAAARGMADAASADAAAVAGRRATQAARRNPSGAFRSKSRSMPRNTAEFSAANPITQAAAPLLILLGRLRLHIVDMQAVPLMNYVAQAITEFEKKIVAAGVHPQEALVAKYVLVRHGRRHRPEPAGHRPAVSGCSTACWRSSSRCARRASASSRS